MGRLNVDFPTQNGKSWHSNYENVKLWFSAYRKTDESFDFIDHDLGEDSYVLVLPHYGAQVYGYYKNEISHCDDIHCYSNVESMLTTFRVRTNHKFLSLAHVFHSIKKKDGPWYAHVTEQILQRYRGIKVQMHDADVCMKNGFESAGLISKNCGFHVIQAVRRWFTNFDSDWEYNKDYQRFIICLSIMCTKNHSFTIEKLVDYAKKLPNQVQDYLYQQWGIISREDLRQSGQVPQWGSEYWSHFGASFMIENPTTNNPLEGNFSCLRKLINRSMPLLSKSSCALLTIMTITAKEWDEYCAAQTQALTHTNNKDIHKFERLRTYVNLIQKNRRTHKKHQLNIHDHTSTIDMSSFRIKDVHPPAVFKKKKQKKKNQPNDTEEEMQQPELVTEYFDVEFDHERGLIKTNCRCEIWHNSQQFCVHIQKGYDELPNSDKKVFDWILKESY